jgi:condensin complex subunit 2
VNTLESNLDNISVKKFDLAFDVDPLFKKTSAAFDEGGAKGLLLNHLSVYNNCEIIFDSTDAVLEDDSAKDLIDSTVEIQDLTRTLLSLYY